MTVTSRGDGPSAGMASPLTAASPRPKGQAEVRAMVAAKMSGKVEVYRHPEQPEDQSEQDSIPEEEIGRTFAAVQCMETGIGLAAVPLFDERDVSCGHEDCLRDAEDAYWECRDRYLHMAVPEDLGLEPVGSPEEGATILGRDMRGRVLHPLLSDEAVALPPARLMAALGELQRRLMLGESDARTVHIEVEEP